MRARDELAIVLTPNLKSWKTHSMTPRVFAKISNIPVQNSNTKISARPDLASNLL